MISLKSLPISPSLLWNNKESILQNVKFFDVLKIWGMLKYKEDYFIFNFVNYINENKLRSLFCHNPTITISKINLLNYYFLYLVIPLTAT